MTKNHFSLALAFIFLCSNASNAKESSSNMASASASPKKIITRCFNYNCGPGNNSDYKFPKEKCIMVTIEGKTTCKTNEDIAKNEIAPIQENKTLEDQNLQKPKEISKKRENPKTEYSNFTGAKTKGHYVGVSAIYNKVRFAEKIGYYNGSSYTYDYNKTTANQGGGLGLDYKYAFNFNDFFIAPGLFYEKIDNYGRGSRSTYGNTRDMTNVAIKDRYGATVNFGYDVNDYFSPYISTGYGMFKYHSRSGIDYLGNHHSINNASTGQSSILGAGLKLNYNKSLSFIFDFSTQRIKMKNNIGQLAVSINNDLRATSTYVGRIESIKFGIFYNF